MNISRQRSTSLGPASHQHLLEPSIITSLPITPPPSTIPPKRKLQPPPLQQHTSSVRQLAHVTIQIHQQQEVHLHPQHHKMKQSQQQQQPQEQQQQQQRKRPPPPADQVLTQIKMASSSASLHHLLQYKYKQAYLADFTQQVLASLEDLTPQEAARLLWFMHHTQQRSAPVLQQLVPLLYNGLGQLSSGELVDVLLAYAGLGQYEHELFAAMSEFVWDKLPELDPAGLAAVAWAYAVVDHFYDDEDMFNALAEAAVARLPFFHPADLAALAWAFAQLRYRPPHLLPELLAHAASHAQQFSVQELSDIVWACARLQQEGIHASLRGVGNYITSQLAAAAAGSSHGVPGERMVNSRHAGHSIHIHRDGSLSHEMDGWMAGLTGGFVGRQQQHSSSSGSSSSVQVTHQGWSPYYGKSYAPDDGVDEPEGPLRHMARSAVQRGVALPSALVRLCWSYGALRHMHEQMMTQAYRHMARFPETAYTDGELALLQQAQLQAQEMSGAGAVNHPQLAESISIWQNTRCRGQSCKLALPAHLQVAAFTAWQLAQLSPAPPALIHSWKFPDPERFTAAAMQRDVRQQLSSMGAPAVVAKVTLDGSHSVPLAQRQRGRHLSWEVLGPELCLRSEPYSRAGEAVVRHRSLEFRGWSVVQVPFHEWAGLEDDAAKQQYLQRKLESLGS